MSDVIVKLADLAPAINEVFSELNAVDAVRSVVRSYLEDRVAAERPAAALVDNLRTVITPKQRIVVLAIVHDAFCEKGKELLPELHRDEMWEVDIPTAKGTPAAAPDSETEQGGKTGLPKEIQTAIAYHAALSTARDSRDPDAVRLLQKWLPQVPTNLTQPGAIPNTNPEAKAVRRKRSTVRGEGQEKLIAALTKHHRYADGSCLNLEPIGNNELAKAAGVSPSTASAFFKREFGGHSNYKAMCRDAARLAAALKLLNDEFAPYHLLGAASSDLAAPEQDDADSE